MSAESELIRLLQLHNSCHLKNCGIKKRKESIMCLENEYNRTGQEAVHKSVDKIYKQKFFITCYEGRTNNPTPHPTLEGILDFEPGQMLAVVKVHLSCLFYAEF